jgi:hypothetical protein
MTRLFLVRAPGERRPGFRETSDPWEVLSFDKATHRLEFRRADGTTGVDPNFHIDMVKRCGYILTAEVPPEFTHAKQP